MAAEVAIYSDFTQISPKDLLRILNILQQQLNTNYFVPNINTWEEKILFLEETLTDKNQGLLMVTRDSEGVINGVLVGCNTENQSICGESLSQAAERWDCFEEDEAAEYFLSKHPEYHNCEATLQSYLESAVIIRLAVDVQHQRKGLGKQLVRSYADYWDKRGTKNIGVIADNDRGITIYEERPPNPAIPFYASLGFNRETTLVSVALLSPKLEPTQTERIIMLAETKTLVREEKSIEFSSDSHSTGSNYSR